MEIQDIQKYIGFKVLLTLKNGFRYKIFLNDKIIKGSHISFLDKFKKPVDFDVSEISFITMSNDRGEEDE